MTAEIKKQSRRALGSIPIRIVRRNGDSGPGMSSLSGRSHDPHGLSFPAHVTCRGILPGRDAGREDFRTSGNPPEKPVFSRSFESIYPNFFYPDHSRPREFAARKKGKGQYLFLAARKRIPIPARTVSGKSPVCVGVGVADGRSVAEIWAVWPAVTCWVVCQSWYPLILRRTV